jgi:UDP-N-acetylglucosamine 2-epimerase (non-hydrolysing)
MRSPGIAYVVGTRPNLVKMAPVIRELRRRLPHARHSIVHTGQHYDRLMSNVFVRQLGMPSPDHVLGVGSGSHAVQTARAMERLEGVLDLERSGLVMVAGDVNSTLAATLVAVKLGISLGHVESGLRSFDRTMPEEVNRIVADEFADHLFAHCEDAVENLRAESIAGSVHLVGNTMIDSLVLMEQSFRGLETWRRFGLRPGDYLLVTLHRPALVDGPRLIEVLDRLGELSHELPVLFPVHPRTRKMMDGLSVGRGVLLTDPLGYLDFISLEADAAGVLTDSGGVQEETTYLGVPCFTLRDNTERPITLRRGTNTLLGLDPARIDGILPTLRTERPPPAPPALWDGRAAERVAEVVVPALERESLELVGRLP